MKLPEYVTVEEVKRVCRELSISDWTKMKEPQISSEEAEVVLSEVNVEGMEIDLEEFRTGLEVELEHGLTFKDANVTNNHPILTGLIVLAHFKESLDYYKLLEVAELEGDLVKAIVAHDALKIKKYYKRLAEAKVVLSQAELNRLE
ncbi:MAG: hypothetical protein JRG97_15850 [Deltaproteobacteria bacterium]|nr:hypothetical protein [Deltaproteobacteria bacterium]MBW2054000.1 hypothetical protein [Deltaproteobacteria bacterium]MBW2142504.1 hypothetical protein [Deltaproteobacteria bacterium]MBW2324497.1 hypothetical protein [Deltaproteobacteria bacterium]